ncbi:hypothetical protein ACO0LD_27955 [Undibacterium sp. Ji83W]
MRRILTTPLADWFTLQVFCTTRELILISARAVGTAMLSATKK